MGCSIGAFAVIEEDDKVKAEIQRYLRELDPDAVVRLFSNSHEFELFYFKELFKTGEHQNEPEWNPIGGLVEDEIEFLRSAKFQAEKAFEADELELSLVAADFSIEALEHGEGKIFLEDPAHVRSKEFKLLDLIPAGLEKMKKRFEASATLKQDQTVLLCLEKEGSLWAFKVHIKHDGDKLKLNLKLYSKETLKALGRENEALELQSGQVVPVDCIIFRYACVKEKNTRLWVTKIATLLKKAALWPAENRPKFICLRYDNDQKQKAEFSHPFLDDLLCLPLDRLIFLQKLEIALSLPKKIKPGFLFVQEAGDEIEVAKLTSVERVSDLAFSITNPVPLSNGTPAHVYFRFHGQKELLDTYGKVIRTLPHPVLENQHLVFFAYYALDREPFTLIRSQLTKDTGYKLLLNTDAKAFEYNPDNIFIKDHQKRSKTIAIIDLDEKNADNIADNIEREFGNCQVVKESSYFMFFKKYIAKSDSDKEVPNAKSEDLFADMVSFLIGLDDMNFQMALTAPEEEQKLLGHLAHELFSGPQTWMKLFDSHDARELMMETVSSLQSSRRNRRIYPLTAEDGTLKNVAVEFILENNNKVVRLNLSIPDAHSAQKKIKKIDSLDAIVIDQALLPKETDAFLTGLKSAVKEKGLECPPSGPAVILMSERQKQKQVMELLYKNFFSAVQKPIETRRLLFLISEAIDSPFCMYAFENIGWKEDHLQAKLAHPAKMTELSEFGCTVQMGSKLRVGSMLYLFGSIFKNAPDQNLCCRVYHTESVDGEPGQFLNYVIFFGITDSFLKFTRSYIRETYASKKSKESGGA